MLERKYKAGMSRDSFGNTIRDYIMTYLEKETPLQQDMALTTRELCATVIIEHSNEDQLLEFKFIQEQVELAVTDHILKTAIADSILMGCQ